MEGEREKIIEGRRVNPNDRKVSQMTLEHEKWLSLGTFYWEN